MFTDIDKFKNEGYENIIFGLQSGKEIKIVLKDVLSTQLDENIFLIGLKNGSICFIAENAVLYIFLTRKKDS